MPIKEIINAREAVESMVAFVREQLQIQDKKEKETKPALIVTGRGIAGEDADIQFALEVITNIAHSERALTASVIERRVNERALPGLRKDRVFTGIMFPKSIDYQRASAELIGPYFRQADLLSTAKEEGRLIDRYLRFSRYDVKDLSRIEWEFAIPLGGSRIAYYNPLTGNIQIHDFQKFRVSEVIPDNIQLDKGYFWDYARRGYFPGNDNIGKKAEVFRGIQEGLHDRVRHIIRTEEISGSFTLASYGKCGARITSYK